jgi:Spy/CpxP family protein refolding chaperone
MKKIALTISLLAASCVALAEHDPGNGGGGRAEHRARIEQALGLSPEQKEQMQEIREQGGSREEIRSVLTDEQRARARELREHNKGKFEKRLTHMQQNLSLSDEQVSQIQDIRQAGGGREEIEAVLTEEQKAKAGEMRGQRGNQRSGNRSAP